MQGHVFCQGNRQVEPQAQIRAALLKAVDLLFRFAAALGKEHFAGLNDRGIQGREAVQGIGAAEDLHHMLQLLLGGWEKLHEAR